MSRRKLIFGGERLIEPQFCHFHSAITGGLLHGHPGDVALIVSKAESKELAAELRVGLSPNALRWGKEEVLRFSSFAGVKLIHENHAKGYVSRKQASIVECDEDPREWLGLPQKEESSIGD